MQRVDLTIANHELLKKAATRKGISIFALANNLLEDIGIADKEEKVILSIPSSLTRKNKDALRQWLHSHVATIVNAYYPEKINADVKTS